MQSSFRVPGGGPIRTTPVTVTPKGAPKTPAASSPASSSGPSTPATPKAPSQKASSSGQGNVHEFEVGRADVLGKRSLRDGMEVHHVPQQHPAQQVIPGYNPKTASSIVLKVSEHRLIPNSRGVYSGTARDLLAQDLRKLRKHTTATSKQILEISKFAQQQHPEAYIRK